MLRFTFPALFTLCFGVLSGFGKDAMLKQTDITAGSRTHIYMCTIDWVVLWRFKFAKHVAIINQPVQRTCVPLHL